MWWVFGILEVITFFYFANSLTRKWARYSEKKFSKKLFQNALIIRIVWVLVSYAFYNIMTGGPFEFDAADAAGYHGEGMWLADLIHSGNIEPYLNYLKGRFSDMGYTFYL